MKEKENIIKAYFSMWLNKNFEGIDLIFDKNIYYSECYGPEYCGLIEIKQWIDKSMMQQTVLAWDIQQYIHQGNQVVVEWYFKDSISEKVTDFNGVSIIEFTEGSKIISIKEFESKVKHTRPFQC